MKHSLSISLTRNFGAGGNLTINLTSERMVDRDNKLPEFDQLVTSANDMFNHFIAEHLPHMSFGKPADMTTTKTEEIIEVRATMDKGKRYIKIATPQYQEHGINWWPETMEAAGVDPKSFSLEQPYKPKKGTMVEYEMVNGKPKRVIKVISAK